MLLFTNKKNNDLKRISPNRTKFTLQIDIYHLLKNNRTEFIFKLNKVNQYENSDDTHPTTRIYH